MALPQQVIDRLGKEPPHTPGWSFGLLSFSGAILFLALLIYAGLAWGYGPYLDTQLSDLNTKTNALAQSVSVDDQARFVTLYSEIANLRTVLANHVVLSRFAAWLEKHTEANVYYTRLVFSNGNQVALTGRGKTEADVNQQAAIFEAAPEVKNMNLTTVGVSDTDNLWQFSVTLVLDPAILHGSP